jgi:hypothetical protein
LWSALNHQGHLADVARSEELKGPWQMLGWNNINGQFCLSNDNKHVLLLDFDLDCFSTRTVDTTLAWPPGLLFNRMKKTSEYIHTEGWSAERILKEIAKLSPFITIAKESDCCGGFTESQKILEDLYIILWKGEFFSL